MWEICKDLQDEIVTMRRDLHQIPEIGGNLPETKAYVIKKLTEMGIPFTENKSDSGLMAEIRGGKPGKTIEMCIRDRAYRAAPQGHEQPVRRQ